MRYRILRYVGRRLFDKRFTSPSQQFPFGRGGKFNSFFDALNAGSLINKTLQRGGYLDNELWEEAYTEVIDSQIDKAGNAGQETLLGDDYFRQSAKQYCATNGNDYNPEDFISYVKNDLGDDYYNAISEITEECSEELLEAWDYAYAGDGMGEFLFGRYQPARNVFGSQANALARYNALASARYGRNWNTTSAARERSRATATRFLSKYPDGKPG